MGVSQHNVVENLEERLRITYDHGKTWLPVDVGEMEALLRMLKMYCWGVAKGDTVTISRKNNLEMAMVVRKDKIFTSIEGAHFCHPVIVAASVGDMLDDLSAAIVVMLDEMEKVIDE